MEILECSGESLAGGTGRADKRVQTMVGGVGAGINNADHAVGFTIPHLPY